MILVRPLLQAVWRGTPKADGDGIALAHEFAALEWSPRVVLTTADPGVAADGMGDGIVFVAKEVPNAPLPRLVSAASR